MRFLSLFCIILWYLIVCSSKLLDTLTMMNLVPQILIGKKKCSHTSLTSEHTIFFHHNLHLRLYIWIDLNCYIHLFFLGAMKLKMWFHHLLNQDSMIHHSLSNLPTHATLQNSTWCQSNPRSFKNVFISYSPFTYSLPKDRILLHKLLLCYCSSSTHL